MTTQNPEPLSLPIASMRYDIESRRWFLADAWKRFEVEIGGSEEAPDAEQVTLAEEMLPQIETLASEASDFLDAFLDYEKFDREDVWYPEGMLFGAPPIERPSHFGVALTHTGDPYGYWTVIFRRHTPQETEIFKTLAVPIGFHRLAS